MYLVYISFFIPQSAYIEHREVKAAQGVKIAAKDLEKAIAGMQFTLRLLMIGFFDSHNAKIYYVYIYLFLYLKNLVTRINIYVQD